GLGLAAGGGFLAFGLGPAPLSLLPREADLALSAIDAEDLHFDLVADLDDLFGAIHLVVGQLRDVQQALQAGLELDEGAVVREVAHGTLHHGAGRILAGDLVPRVDLGLLHPQGDLLFLLVDAQDDDLDPIADADQLAGVVDPLGPAHLRDMDQAL